MFNVTWAPGPLINNFYSKPSNIKQKAQNILKMFKFTKKQGLSTQNERTAKIKRTLVLFPSKDDIYCSPSRSWNFGLKICVRSTVVSGVVFCYILKDIYARFKSWVFFLLNETRYSLRNKMRNDYHDESNIRDGF